MDIEYRGENCVVVKCKKTIIVVDPTSESSVKEVNNPETGEKARFIVKNGDEVVSIDNYLNAKYLHKK